VKIPASFVFLLTLSLSSCEIFPRVSQLLFPRVSQPWGPNDYAVGVAPPYPQEVKLAKLRLRNFLRRADQRQRLVVEQNPYVAIQANEITAGEDWPLMRRLSTGRPRATELYSTDFRNRSAFGVKFLLIFNSRTGELLRPIGVLAADTPLRGAVGQFAGIRAIYGGTGWW
jgi:hypothetical protein